ncbi:XrtA-associated tyrosine autokinase [Sphingosinicella xenopeptidilytica]|uniref:non-specific protein-tyrosine kinase n=1 Tax=Sphingosinicella xenopeptidilytica TaxID=364098 RepID=A0ABW3C9Z7_SPHXN
MSEEKPSGTPRASLLERAAGRLDQGVPAKPAAPRSTVTPAAAPAPAPAPTPRAPAPVAPAAAAPAPQPQFATPETPVVHLPADDSNRTSRRGVIDLAELRDLGYVVPDAPATATAEEFRIVKRQLLINAMARGENEIRNGNLILVCSAQPNEGKTFCATNLALSIASERDLTVLLVDADFAKPEILSTLGLEGGKGLIDVIADPTLDLSDCLIRTNIENLSVLPAGRQHNLTTELLASERMGDMVEEIAKRYSDRIVIFDSPPALASSAASVLAMHVGQVMFVVEAENTRETELRDGLSMMNGCEHVQMLLNKVRYAGVGRRFGTYYGYGS